MIYQNQNYQVLSIKQLLYSYADNHRWKFYVGLVFLLLTGATALAPKLMGMLIDSVKKSYSDANNIALMLIGILLCNPFFLFRLSLFIDFTEHTLANLRHSI
jgi:hypothetical protein